MSRDRGGRRGAEGPCVGAFFSTLLASVVFVWSVGCGDSPTRPEPGQTREGLLISVTASPAEVLAGQPVTVVVTVTNPTSRDVRLDFNTSCQIVFSVEDASGTSVYPEGGGFVCAQVLSVLSLASGGAKQQTFTWDGRKALSSGGYTYVPAGSYKLYGMLQDRPEERSAPATVVVRAPVK